MNSEGTSGTSLAPDETVCLSAHPLPSGPQDRKTRSKDRIAVSLPMSGRHGLLGFPFSTQTLKPRMAKGPALDPRSVPGCRISGSPSLSRPQHVPSSTLPLLSLQEASFRLQVRGCSLNLYPEISWRGWGGDIGFPAMSLSRPSLWHFHQLSSLAQRVTKCVLIPLLTGSSLFFQTLLAGAHRGSRCFL